MFSKALFKQSCKANGIMWGIITFAVCFMLACVMMISGSGNITAMKTGISNTIIDGAIESSMEGRAINYFLLTGDSLEKFDGYFAEAYASTENEITAYQTAMQKLNMYVNGVIAANGYEEGSDEALEIQGLIFYVLNPNGTYNEFYTNLGETAPNYDMLTVASETRADYRNRYARLNTSIFLAGNMISETNINRIVERMESYGVTADSYAGLTYEVTEDGEKKQVSKYTGATGFTYIKKLSNDTLITFEARLKEELLLGTDKETAIENITGGLTDNFMSSMPDDVSDALSELGEMDLYSVIVGSIFFKMAGLLLPLIYMIMVANNLIAGQVDSGSMAYVLSTSTKRKQVVFTQAVFLIGSLAAMFACTTITSLVCLRVLNSSAITLSYVDLLLLNLGAFLTMFAMSGISFLASCWFNRGKHSMSIGGGLNMFFLVASMLGLFGSKVLPSVVRLSSLEFFNYVSIISLFDVTSILDGGTTFIWKLAILLAVGVVCYIIGAIKFERKDLPL